MINPLSRKSKLLSVVIVFRRAQAVESVTFQIKDVIQAMQQDTGTPPY
jgi:glycerol kinase